MVLILGALLVLGGVAVGSGPAHADGSTRQRTGALGQVTSSVQQRTRTESRPSTGAPTSGSYPRPHAGDTYPYDAHGISRPYPCSTCGPAVAVLPAAPGNTARRGPARLVLELGLQSVEDSDGAASAGFRLTSGGVGLSASAIRYFERGAAMDGSGTIHMDIWAVSAMGRLIHAGATSVWGLGGLGSASSNEFEQLLGPVVGVAVEHALTATMTLHGGARYLALEQDVHAGELRAGLEVSFLSVGYRVLRFDTGPALRGPELTLHLAF